MAKHENDEFYVPRPTPLNSKDHVLVTNYLTKETQSVPLGQLLGFDVD